MHACKSFIIKQKLHITDIKTLSLSFYNSIGIRFPGLHGSYFLLHELPMTWMIGSNSRSNGKQGTKSAADKVEVTTGSNHMLSRLVGSIRSNQ